MWRGKRRGHSNELRYPWYYFILKSYRDFSLVVQWLRFCLQCRVCRFNPWSGSWDPTCLMAKKTKTLCKSSVVTNSIKTLKRAHIKKKNLKALFVSFLIYLFLKGWGTGWVCQAERPLDGRKGCLCSLSEPPVPPPRSVGTRVRQCFFWVPPPTLNFALLCRLRIFQRLT